MPLEQSKQRDLAAWLGYIEALHPKSIAMGLERVNQVKQRLQLNPTFPIITVAGTNGKGSTCAMLSRIYHEAGYQVATYSSPHLIRYNERVCVACEPVSDEALCEAFAAIEDARGEIELTYFEYGTLAAMWHFMHCEVDVAILEVGLGGRLDAVNIFEPVCSLVTSIDLDHIEYLGNTRESIGFEKAGVFRSGCPAICGDLAAPSSLLQHAANINADLKLIGRDFFWKKDSRDATWSFKQDNVVLDALPLPALLGEFQMDNAACALAAITAMQNQLPLSQLHIELGLSNVTLAGRFQTLSSQPNVILDVAHNPHAATALSNNLKSKSCLGRTLAVFSMLADKDIATVVEALKSDIDSWYVSAIDHVRGASAEQLLKTIQEHTQEKQIVLCADVASAYHQACIDATENDRIIVFGSFFTVAEVLHLAPSKNQAS